MEAINKRINNIVDTKLQTAIAYYKLIMTLNNKELTEMEFNMLGLLAVYGSISSPPNRERFIKIFNSTNNSINTTISNMYKKDLIKKINGKNVIADELRQDFSKPILMNILMIAKDQLQPNQNKINEDVTKSSI